MSLFLCVCTSCYICTFSYALYYDIFDLSHAHNNMLCIHTAGKSCEELAGFSDDSKHERLLSGDATTAAVDVADWRSVSGESNTSTSKRI